VPHDPNQKFAAYTHPERLVSTQWLADHLGEEGLVVVESDEDVLLYETGHIPGAVKIDWHLDLNDPVTRDYIDGEGFAKLMSTKGIKRDDTVVIYGDKSNWWAAYALWVFTLFGHEDVRLLDGGRAKWEAEGRPMTTDEPSPEPTDYPVVERDDSTIRAFRDDVLANLDKPLIDVRSPEEYSGQRTTAPAYPDEGALRAGHIPTARNVPWARAAADDGTFKGRSELDAIYRGEVGLAEGRELTREPAARPTVDYPVVERDDATLRAFRDDVLAHLGKPLVDVRSPEEYSGERTTAPAYPEEGALRAGHIPTAASVPWGRAVNEDGTFRSRAELEAIYLDGAGLRDADDVVAYCRIGERSSHTWFVLQHLLGLPRVRNYDGSWTEWGSLVGVPIAVGAEPGEVPAR